ncbi:uncharacterized protein LOC129457036 [Periophthalmus magnuspinnatus]|uniref:uncharacterized protein LOC129457036 n=1 Tax=Periophthalmus magnuspinnatus TaxID=409849 RepID=UPI0024373A34|nr:uncharacterized protein LOC129457036 [Periophthalmus magnuspinnatus]
MGFMLSFDIDAPVDNLAAFAREICPFPNYFPDPHYYNLLSANSSHHLQEHYISVQSSLSPKQLEDFTQSLRSTFGRHGRVSHGGVGVVALSLAILFDTVARKVKGEYVSDREPIPGLFLKDYRGYYPTVVYTISEYLRLVPHIANNPTRMKEESERCLEQIDAQYREWQEAFNQKKDIWPLYEDISAANIHFSYTLGMYLLTVTPSHYGKEQSVIGDVLFQLNCDPEEAANQFISKMHTYDKNIQDSIKDRGLDRESIRATLMKEFAETLFFRSIIVSLFKALETMGKAGKDQIKPYVEHFDLKGNALGKW